MIEILPNWHPIFVHFTVALFTISAGFYFLAYICQAFLNPRRSLFFEFEIVGRWCLWMAAFITIFTVLAGFYAYNTVRHDAISHRAMTDHRNWALVTASTIILIAIWSGVRYHNRKIISISFLLALIVAEGLLLLTAWKGGELVYRHGLGVMSLPKIEMEGHPDKSTMENVKTPSGLPTMEKEQPQQHTH